MGIILIILGIIMYTLGENYNKNFKYAMGIPMGIIAALVLKSFIPLLAILSYLIANEIGYGDNNLLTKWVGKRLAIVIHGTALGLACFPIVWGWALLSGIISCLGFIIIDVFDRQGKIGEPWVAIFRALSATIIFILT